MTIPGIVDFVLGLHGVVSIFGVEQSIIVNDDVFNCCTTEGVSVEIKVPVNAVIDAYIPIPDDRRITDILGKIVQLIRASGRSGKGINYTGYSADIIILNINCIPDLT